MRKKGLITLLVTFILICGLCNAVFNLGTYDFMARLKTASNLEFNNPIDTMLKVFNNIKSITNWGDLSIQWYEYIPRFFNWIGSIFSSLFDGIVETGKTLLNGLRFVLIMLGWNF